MKRNIILILIYVFELLAVAQENTPTDYLSKEFHKARREAFRNLMPENSVAVIFSSPERNFSNDIDYVFHQNPNLYYLTGYKEPDAVLVIFKENQQIKDSLYKEILFVRDRDKNAETWTGRRLGREGAKTTLGFDFAYSTKEFKNFPLDFKQFKTIIYEIPADKNKTLSGFDLTGLINTFKQRTNIVEEDRVIHNIHIEIGKYSTMQNLDGFISYVKQRARENKAISDDIYIQQFIAKPDSAQLEILKKKLISLKDGVDFFSDIVSALRQVKTSEELTLLRKAVIISALGHSEVMKAVNPGMSEREVEGIHRYIHSKYGSEEEGYPPIIGAGANACILHYMENSSTKIDNQLILMDVGAEYHGYSADITRTIPANGKFTPEQKVIYQLVYDAQEAVFKLCTEGNTFQIINDKSNEILANGLLKLGIIKDKKEAIKYSIHGVSHFIGLDVHDFGEANLFKENMVITVEPGIYIPNGSDCDKKWWNIGVRIEDDVLIGKGKYEILSTYAPRKWEDVEKKIKEKSKLNEMNLPEF